MNPHQDGVEYCPVLRAGLVLVCSSTLAPDLKSRSALARCTKIKVLQSPLDWEVWLQKNKCTGLTFANVQQYDNLLLAIEAAIHGAGVLVIPDFIVHDHLHTGRLVSPLGAAVPQLGQWYLAFAHARKFDKGVIGFKKWLGNQLST